MANETQEPKPQGNTNLEGAQAPELAADVGAKPIVTTPAEGNGAAVSVHTTDEVPGTPVPAEANVPAAGPAPQVVYTPDASATTSSAEQTQSVPAPSDALIGSWLAEHIHYADLPYVVLVILIAFLLGSFAANNTDIWHYLATGRLLSEGKYTLGEDPFAVAGAADESRTWINQTWLFSWLSYVLYSEGGTLLVVLKALFIAALAGILLLIRPRNRHGWVGTLCVLLGILAASLTGFHLRPLVISLLFLGAMLFILQRAGVLSDSEESAQPKLLWALPALFALWVNLDSWFMFGLMIMACCLVGLLLEAGLGRKPHFSIRQLSMVLGLSLLASLLNPHHIRAVLLLPVELSYLLVKTGNFWPETMVAGGQALHELQRLGGPGFQATLSPLSSPFWSTSTQGLNVAGISFFVLLALVLFSFYLCRQANPGMLLVRAVPTLLCGILALLLIQLIPLFAIVGAVVALLNIQEYLAWRETVQPTRFEEQSMWANMTRLIMGFGFFGLLFLAWPGWISHTMGDFASPRRVAWSVKVDPSLEETAKFLRDKNAAGELKLALNLSRDVANFCAWHAPGMRFFIDRRLQLFDRQAAELVQLYGALMDEFQMQKRTSKLSWRTEFARYGVDSIICPANPRTLNNAVRDPFYLFMMGMVPASIDPRIDLRAAYADGKTAVLCWTKAIKTPIVGLADQWREEALGRHEAPWPTEIPLAEDSSFWGLYIHGQPPPSLAAQKSALLRHYFENMNRAWSNVWFNRFGKVQPLWELACLGLPNNVSAGPFPLLFTAWDARLKLTHDKKEDQDFYQRLFGQKLPAPSASAPDVGDIPIWMHQLTLVDEGPAEAALLSVKAARKAVTNDPRDPASHYMFALAIAYLNQRQESYWVNVAYPFLQQNPSLRSNFRKYQYVASLQRYARLKPRDPDIHLDLYSYFYNENCMDMALEHLQLCSEYLDSSKMDDQQRAGVRKNIEEAKKRLKEEVDDRLKDLRATTQDRDSAFTKAEWAFRKPFPKIGRDGKRETLPSRGLLGEARKLLVDFLAAQAKPGAGANEAEAREVPHALQMLFEIDLQIGNVWELKDISIAHMEKHPQYRPLYHAYMFYLHGVTGDYAKADKALEEYEQAQLPIDEYGRATVASQLLPSSLALASPGATLGPLMAYVPFYVGAPPVMYIGPLQYYQNVCDQQEVNRAERLAMRGILAMEAGNTVQALAHFRQALSLAGRRYFGDRGVAERYKQLLEMNP